jgi:hypothetical protein
MPKLRFGKVWQVIHHFGVLFFAILVPLKQLNQNSPPRQILLPHIFPHMVTPTIFPVDNKRLARKKVLVNNVLIPF